MAVLSYWTYLCPVCRNITEASAGPEFRPLECSCGSELIDACSQCEGPLNGYYKAVGWRRLCSQCEAPPAPPLMQTSASVSNLQLAAKMVQQASEDIRNLEPKTALVRLEQAAEVLRMLAEEEYSRRK